MTAPIWEWPKEHRGTIRSTFRLMPKNLMSSSPYTDETTAYGPVSQRWQASIELPTKRGPDWRYLSGFLTRLNGIAGRLRIVDYNRMRCGYDVAVLYGSGGSVENWSDGKTWSDGSGWETGFLPPFVVTGEARERGQTDLLMQGFPASITKVLRHGDLFEHRPNGMPAAHGCLYEVTANHNSDASGKTRVEFEPGLRIDVLAGDQIVLRYPTSVFRLLSDTEGTINRGLANLGNLGLSLIEILPEEAVL